jgi:hypothetical protein
MSATIIDFPARPPIPLLSRLRRRDEVLQLLVPKMLGLVWERGEVGVTDHVVHAVEQSVHIVTHLDSYFTGGEAIYGISVYAAPGKVLSTHVAIAHGSPKAYPYLLYRCAVISWKRGVWEDVLFGAQVTPRTIEQLAATGLTPKLSASA